MASRDDDQNLEWYECTDFSPGIVRTTHPVPGWDAATHKTFGPRGSASIAKGCLVSPSGAIVPGWARQSLVNHALPAPYTNWGSTYRPTAAPSDFLVGSAILSPMVATQTSATSNRNEYPDHLFLLYASWFDSGAASQYKMHQTWVQTWPTDATTARTSDITAFGPGLSASAVTGSDRRRVGGYLVSGYSCPWTAIGNTWTTVPPIETTNPLWFATGYAGQTGSEAGDRHAYPDPDIAQYGATAGDTPIAVAFGLGDLGAYHQGRLVVAGSDDNTTYGLTHAFEGDMGQFDGRYLGVYEMTSKTGAGVSESPIYLLDSQISKIASLFSVNANSLFIQMDSSGGYVIAGDLDRPQVTHLPGIPSAFGMATVPTSTPLGVFFTSRQGLHLWNQGADAQLISKNLPGNFWMSDDWATDRRHGASKGKLGYVDPFVMMPNGWIVDTRNGSFWQLEPVQGAIPAAATDANPPFHYEVGSTGAVYAISESLDQNHAVNAVQYDPSIMGNDDHVWRWTSNAIQEMSASGHSVVVRQLELVVSGAGTMAVTVTAGAVSQTLMFAIDGTHTPVKLYMDQAVRSKTAVTGDDITGGANAVTYGFVAEGSSSAYPAPIVHAIRIGFIRDSSVPHTGVAL